MTVKKTKLIPAVVAALFSGLSAIAQAQDAEQTTAEENPFDAIPFNDPQALQQLGALDDGEFLRRLFDTGKGPKILDRYFPPDVTVFPMSHGFAGTREACLRDRTVLTCRLYVHDLVSMHEEKRGQRRVLSNPFAPVR